MQTQVKDAGTHVIPVSRRRTITVSLRPAWAKQVPDQPELYVKEKTSFIYI